MPETKERFAVDTAGLRELHAGREPWTLLKELIQNSWDEAPEATFVAVNVSPVPRRKQVKIVVTDDGPGFANVSDAWTLMAHTQKRHDPTKRGRFNLGEKEVISVATEATIETVGHTIVFPKGGGRQVKRNKRERGTTIELLMPWRHADGEEAVRQLRNFLPTDCRLIVNDEEVVRRQPIRDKYCSLETVLNDAPGEPLRQAHRMTTIDILPRRNDKGWIYEMGIPVQETEIGFDVNVHQKIPMPPNRNTVSETYLSNVATETLNATHDLLGPDEAGELWVRTGLGNYRVTAEAVVSTVRARYGEKVVMWSPDTIANMKAIEAGYEVLHPRSMSEAERRILRDLGKVESAKVLFGSKEAIGVTVVDQTPEMKRFAGFVKNVGRSLGILVDVQFIEAIADTIADCQLNTDTPLMRFNVYNLPAGFFDVLGTSDQFELILHELAHAQTDSAIDHGSRWGQAAANLGARLLYTSNAYRHYNPDD